MIPVQPAIIKMPVVPPIGYLEELDPTHKTWCPTMGGPHYNEIVGYHSGWCNDGHFRDMCDCDEICRAPFPAKEDSYS